MILIVSVAWLQERQLSSGGLNGRPGKKEDACYAWWVCASLKILDKLDDIRIADAISFVVSLQRPEGGIGAHKGDRADIFHTHFGIAALSVLGVPSLAPIHPALCLPLSILPAHVERR